MYKLVACDIDGTLLNSDLQISQYTKQVIGASIKKGVHFVLATGRIFGSARVYARQLGLDTAILACNGAIAKNASDAQIIFDDPLPKKTCRELFEHFEKEGTYYQFYGEETFFAPKMAEEAMYFKRWTTTLNEEDRVPVVHAKDPFEILEKEKIYKIFIKSEGEEERKYHKNLIEGRGDVTLTSSWKTNYEINSKGVSKGSGVMKFARTLGIKREEIICIGDNHNDADMISVAGLGIAMGNADEEIKALAKYVTESNDEDGVARAINRFLL